MINSCRPPLRTLRRAALCFALALLVSPTYSSEQKAPDTASVFFRVAEGEGVSFRGVLADVPPGGFSGPILYPAPDAGTFLAAVVTHGLLSDSTRQKAQREQEDAADRVVARYLPQLQDLTLKELLEFAIRQLNLSDTSRIIDTHAPVPSDGWTFHGLPVFRLSQSERALVLEHAITIAFPGSDRAPLPLFVTAVSSPIDLETHKRLDTTARGQWIRQTGAELIAESVSIALRTAQAGGPSSTAPHRTYKYLEGDIARFERAQLVSQHCDRMLLVTLRGGMLSVPQPMAHGLQAEDCSDRGGLGDRRLTTDQTTGEQPESLATPL